MATSRYTLCMAGRGGLLAYILSKKWVGVGGLQVLTSHDRKKNINRGLLKIYFFLCFQGYAFIMFSHGIRISREDLLT
jgi:hypothetical protein